MAGQLSRYTLYKAGSKSETYTADGKLVAYGVGTETTSHEYLASGKPLWKWDSATDTSESYIYDGDENLVSISYRTHDVDDDGERIIYGKLYSAGGNLLESTILQDTEDGYRVERYDPSGNMVGYSLSNDIADDSTRVDYYSAAGKLEHYDVLEVSRDTSRTITRNYTSDGAITGFNVSQKSASGETTVEYFDIGGNLLRTEVYNEFGDLIAAHDVPQVKFIWYPNNTLSTFGLSLRDLRPELTDKWYHVTPVDLSKQGTHVLELIASNVYIVGQVLVNVQGDQVVVTYDCKGMNNDTLRMESEFFTFFPSLDDITSANPEDLGEGFKFGEPLSIEKDLDGNTTQLLFVRNVATYRDHLTKTKKYVRLWPNQPHRKEMRQQMLDFIGEPAPAAK